MKELPSEEEEIPFRIKTYKKKELACMYNPNITPSYCFTTPIYFYLLAVSRVASLVAGVDTFIAQLAADSSIHLSFHL